MITKDRIHLGIIRGVIKFVVDPNAESGTVCQIGDNWFYFGGLKAEELSPEEYVKNVPESDIVREIYEVLEDFRKDGSDISDEYKYYDAVISEALENGYHKCQVVGIDLAKPIGEGKWYEFITDGSDVDYGVDWVYGFDPSNALINYCRYYENIKGAHMEAICSVCFESAIQLANEWISNKIVNIHEVGDEVFCASDCNINTIGG